MVGLLVAMLGSDAQVEVAVPLAIAVVLSMTGDVLLLPQVDRFVPGLGSFLAAHVAYVIALFPLAASWRWALAGLAVGGGLILVAGRTIIRGAADHHRALAAPVGVYMAALVALLTAGLASSVAMVAVGAVSFVVSDAVLGWNRFVAPLPHGRLVTHVLYHVGQAAIVAGALAL